MVCTPTLGALLTAVPALRALADAFPDHHRTLATPSWLAPVVEHLGVVDAVVAHPGLGPLPPSVHGADVAVDLHGGGPSSQPVLLGTGPRRLVAFAHPALPATWGGPQWRADEHQVTRWCRLLSESGIPADPHRLDVAPPDVDVPAGVRGATVVHPGAADASQRWPMECFAAVARAEEESGRPVVVTGTVGERPLALRLAAVAGIPEERVLAGRTDLLELLAVVSSAGRVVCGDTGTGHVATAVGTPSVVLFGSVPPDEWGPPRDRLQHRALWAGRPGGPGDDRCDHRTREVTADDVLLALADLPERPTSPRRRAIRQVGPPRVGAMVVAG